jgi:arylsulfatase A-like enzyme
MTDQPKDLDQRPNIVYIHSHDTGRYVQPYGYPVATPAYQRLAEEGVVFRQAFSAAPTCSPSRAALLTGQSPHSSGMLGLAHRGFGLHEPSQHLASTLRDHGYRTVLAGTQHVLPPDGDPAQIGYAEDRIPADGSSDAYARAAVQVLEEHASHGHTPLFLDIGFSDTHRPFPVANPETARYVRPPAPFPDTPEIRLDFAAYLASLERLDRAVGTVLDALGRTGLAASTLVVCTTDHGLAFPSMKCNLTDHGLGVLLIMRGPAGFGGGQVNDALVSHTDIFPTICDVADIEPPSWLQGHSLMPLIRGEATAIREEVFGDVTYHAAYDPQRSIRTQRWTLIVRHGNRERVVLPNIDDSPTRSYLLDHGWDQRPVDAIQLYDNLFDPGQVKNLVTEPSHAAIVAELHHRLHEWMVRTNDPLLDGTVRLPPGGIATDVDASSAESGISRP